MLHYFAEVCLVYTVVLCIQHAASDQKAINANSSSGPVVGYGENVLGKELQIYLGIPYAKPPTGELRFRPPVPVEPWTSPKEAKKLPPTCYQVVDTAFDKFPGVDMWNPNTGMSEDCLYLNIWAPASKATSGKGKAVLVWIYGGGFITGSSTLDIYNGRILAAQGDVVVVSMQYRVSSLGFLYLGIPSAPGNVGLLDQQLALKWVKENIESFGGDPDRITLFGESAGAGSVSLHTMAPSSQPYFTSAIMQSGAYTCPWALTSPSVARKKTLFLADMLECPTQDKSDEDIVKCLQQLSPGAIVNKTMDLPANLYKLVPQSPVKDGKFLMDSPPKDGPILLGMNENEGMYFLAYMFPDLFGPHVESNISRSQFHSLIPEVISLVNIPAVLSDLVAFEYTWNGSDNYRMLLDGIRGDIAFKCDILEFANFYLTTNPDVYLYNFNHISSANPWPAWMGVMHGYEIDHVFGAPQNASLGYSPQERQLSSQMITYWTNFAKTG